MELKNMDDVERSMSILTRELEDWENNDMEHSYANALQLLAHLSIFKLLCNGFDDLPYFTLKLKEMDQIVNESLHTQYKDYMAKSKAERGDAV